MNGVWPYPWVGEDCIWIIRRYFFRVVDERSDRRLLGFLAVSVGVGGVILLLLRENEVCCFCGIIVSFLSVFWAVCPFRKTLRLLCECSIDSWPPACVMPSSTERYEAIMFMALVELGEFLRYKVALEFRFAVPSVALPTLRCYWALYTVPPKLILFVVVAVDDGMAQGATL